MRAAIADANKREKEADEKLKRIVEQEQEREKNQLIRQAREIEQKLEELKKIQLKKGVMESLM